MLTKSSRCYGSRTPPNLVPKLPTGVLSPASSPASCRSPGSTCSGLQVSTDAFPCRAFFHVSLPTHCALQGMQTKSGIVCVHTRSLQSRPTLCNPMDCSPPGSFVHDSPAKNTGAGCQALRIHLLLIIMSTKISCVRMLERAHHTPQSMCTLHRGFIERQLDTRQKEKSCPGKCRKVCLTSREHSVSLVPQGPDHMF